MLDECSMLNEREGGKSRKGTKYGFLSLSLSCTRVALREEIEQVPSKRRSPSVSGTHLEHAVVHAIGTKVDYG